MHPIINYYSRNDIKRSILNISSNREVSFKFGDKGFGKRPDILQFDEDIVELARQGVTSFHVSEEIWSNPLILKTGMSRKELDNLRIGWDLVLDIDGLDIEMSRITAELILEALNYYDIQNPSIKFSGNKGFHIALPYKAIPKKANNLDVNLMFPEFSRIIANFIKGMIKEPLAKEIQQKYTLKELENKYKIDYKSLVIEGKLNPYSLLDIDSILISSRHMFRAPYSINEKSGLASIPITKNSLKNFDLSSAKLENVEATVNFLNTDDFVENEAKQLFIQALDWQTKQKAPEIPRVGGTQKYTDSVKISDIYFPDCIKKILSGMKADGKKRALFILITFLKKSNYSFTDIEPLIYSWNKKNSEPLPDNYIKTQLSWHKRQTQDIMPPNCDNEAYYSSLNIKCSYCDKFKNPLNYASRMSFQAGLNKRTRKKT